MAQFIINERGDTLIVLGRVELTRGNYNDYRHILVTCAHWILLKGELINFIPQICRLFHCWGMLTIQDLLNARVAQAA